MKFADGPEDGPEPQQREIWARAMYPSRAALNLCAIHGLMVSSFGRVRFTLENRVTFGTRRPEGYFNVQRAGRFLLVHRLVAGTFLGQPETGSTHVNHIDGNPGNNRLCNLEYATPSQNVTHAITLRKGQEQRPRTGKAVLACRNRKGLHREQQCFDSIQAAALQTGVSATTISKACRGHQARSLEWEFKFAADECLPGEEWRQVVLEGARVKWP